jgi:hypothetical protein
VNRSALNFEDMEGDTIGLAVRIKNQSIYAMRADRFEHATSAPFVVVDERRDLIRIVTTADAERVTSVTCLRLSP